MAFGEDLDSDPDSIVRSSRWDLSSWNMDNIKDLYRTMNEMQELSIGSKMSSIPLSRHLQSSSRNEGNDGVLTDGDIGKAKWGDDTATSRRLRSQNYPLRPHHGEGGESSSSSGSTHRLEQQQQEKKWEDEADGMEGEFMDYFLKETGNKKQRKRRQKMVIGESIRPGPKANTNNEVTQRSGGTTINRQHNKPEVNNSQRNVQQQYTLDDPFSTNCTDPNAAGLECPPEDLPQICDKYNGGNMEDCFQMCKISFCCIHDSKSKKQAPSCSKEVNCKNWHPCYIVWWKLHDTIGSLNFVRVEQSDDFFNSNLQVILNNETIDEEGNVSPFYLQWFMHHFDDDMFKRDYYVEDPENW